MQSAPLTMPGNDERAAESGPPFSIVCFSSQNWHNALPTNRQRIMSRAAHRGHEVIFVETGGWLPRHLWTLVRGPRRRSLARRLTGGELAAPGVRVYKLFAIAPFSQRYSLSNRINWRLGAGRIKRAARALPRPLVTWIYDPRAAESIDSFGETFAVYDCVDDYAEQARDDHRSRALVAATDRAAADGSRLVFTTTRPLFERHSHANPATHLVPNVGDYEHFAAAADRAHADSDLLALPRPVLGFIGNIDGAKVDFGLLRDLAAAFPESTLLLVGPARDRAREEIEALATQPNVRWLGLRPYAELPKVLAAFDVALIPYAENEYTRSCFPLKLYEYLSAGKPVVATGLPELAGLDPEVRLAHGADDTAAAIRAALADADERKESRIALGASNTWETRTTRLLDLVQGELTREGRGGCDS